MAQNNLNAARDQIKTSMPDYLSELGVNKLNKNFSCLSPYHDDRNPSMQYNPATYQVHCYGCGVTWDIFDLYAVVNDNASVSGTEAQYDYIKVMKELAAKYGVTIPDNLEKNEGNQIEAMGKAKINDYIAYTIKEAPKHLEETDYFLRRGISLELAKRFNLGYVEKWINPVALFEGKAQHIPASPRLIIPTSNYSYIARDTRENIPDAQQQYKKSKAGNSNLFNKGALYRDDKPIFLVEGEIDALSILEISNQVEAVGLGSTTNQKKLIDTLKAIQRRYEAKNRLYDPQFLIAMDNDNAGELANHQLEKKLQGLGFDNVHIVTKSLLGSYKDANEALVKDRARLQKRLENVLKDPDQYLINLLKRIQENMTQQRFIPTGFDNLDKVLDGGLYPQLYVIGAVSSLGKTTFTLQIADNVARKNHPVFFFSLETSKDTLTEKNISRITFDTAGDNDELPQTARSIDNGFFLEIDEKGFKHPQIMKHVTRAFSMYKEYYQYLMINNGITNRPSAQDIYNQVQAYCVQHPSTPPVVIVDYLQILKPLKDNLTDKEAVTSSIAKLNELTEKFHAPVILISSFNRQNYETEVSMQSFKESGEIEYYSDVLMGLQYQEGHKPDFEDNDPMTPRKIEAVILKNRNGVSRGKVGFDFYSAFNEFIPEVNY